MAPPAYQSIFSLGTDGGSRLKPPVILKCGNLMFGNFNFSLLKKPRMAAKPLLTMFFALLILLDMLSFIPPKMRATRFLIQFSGTLIMFFSALNTVDTTVLMVLTTVVTTVLIAFQAVVIIFFQMVT